MARKRIATILGQWSLQQFEEKATLVASELIANAVTEIDKVSWPGARPPVRVWLRGGPSRVAVLVGDAVVAAPVPRLAAPDDEDGRGLFLVAQYSAAWGFYFTDEFSGKITWPTFDRP
jgi:hypothetical protein